MKDFTQETLFDPILPVAMMQVPPEKYARIVIRAKPGSLKAVFDETKTAWARLYPMKPFRGYYQDEIAGEASRVNESIATIFAWFAIISVLNGSYQHVCIGLPQRIEKIKEIAIRKVVGAEDRHIFQLVLKGYFWIFLLSAIIGCYGGYSLSKLLMDLIFRINVGVSTSSLVISFIYMLLLSQFLVFFHSNAVKA